MAASAATAQPMRPSLRSAALGGAVVLDGGPWADENPALIAGLRGPALALFTANGYALEALRLSALSVAIPVGRSGVGFQAQSYGFDAFQRTRFTATFARGFSVGPPRRFLAGVSVAHERTVIEGYGNAGAVDVSVGWMAAAAPLLMIGMSAQHLNAPAIAPGERIPRRLGMGVSYGGSGPFLVALDAVKDARYPIDVRGGIEMRPVPALALRGGGGMNPSRATLGVGITVGRLAAEFAAERHYALGWTPGFGVCLSL